MTDGENRTDQLFSQLVEEIQDDPMSQAMVRDHERMQRGEKPLSADELYVIGWWLRIAAGENELPCQYARFIALWEAFNGWLRARRNVRQGQNRTGDFTLLKDFANDTRVNRHFEELRDSNVNYKRTLKKLERMSPVYEVWGGQRRRQRMIQSPYHLFGVLNLLYQIRCNLFHCGKGEGERDLTLTQLAYDALYPLFREVVADREITFVPVRTERMGQ